MAGAGDQFCLRWNNFQSNIVSVLDNLKEQEDLVDVTLVCEGHAVKAHKVILSACSPYFRNVFKENPCQHPIVILKDVHNAELDALLSFMYQGEVYISQDRLSSFLRTAEILQVRGLAGATAPANLLGEQTQTKNQRNKASAGRGTPPPLVPPHQQREATSPPQAKRRKTTPRRVVENASGVVAVPQVGVKQEPLDDEQLGICREEDQLKMDPEEEDEEPDEPFLPPSGSQSPLASDESTSMLARSLTAPRDATGSNSPLQSLLLSGSVDGSLTISDQQQQLSPGSSSVALQGQGACRRPRDCPLCRRTFSNHFNMKQHVMNVHAPPVPAQCPKCGCVVRNRLYLRKHLVKAHNAPLRRVFDSSGRRVYVHSP